MKSIRIEEGNGRASENSKGQASRASPGCFGHCARQSHDNAIMVCETGEGASQNPRSEASGGTKPCSVSWAPEWWSGLG